MTLDPSNDRAATGIQGLDDVLNGGFPRNRIHLIEGDPGCGKTTLALQFLMEGQRQNEAGLYVTLSETPEELHAVASSHQWDLGGLHICDLAASEESLRADAQYTLFHPSEVELGETTETILSEVERVQPSRVVIDSLSEVRLLARDPLRYRRQILALKRYFAGRKITVLLLNDRNSDVGDTQLPTLVYGVVSLENLFPAYGPERRRLRVTKLRGSAYSGGYHDFELKTGGIEVYPRLTYQEGTQDFKVETVSSGIPEMDALLYGGVHRGTNTLIQGPAGVGKSTLSIHFCVTAAQRGERAFFYTFDEDLGTLFLRCESLGIPLKQCVDEGSVVLQQLNPSEVSPGGFARMVHTAVLEHGARIVVVDSLNGYLFSMPEERFLTAHLHELFTFLNRQGVVTLTLMAQNGLVGAPLIMDSTIDVSYLSDAIILIRYFEAGGEVRKALSVMKNRSGPHERTIRELVIDQTGLHVGEPLHNFVGILTGTPEYRPNNQGSDLSLPSCQ